MAREMRRRAKINYISCASPQPSEREFCFCAITNERCARYLILIDICGKVIDTWTYRNQRCAEISHRYMNQRGRKAVHFTCLHKLAYINARWLIFIPFERRRQKYSCVCPATLYLCASRFYTRRAIQINAHAKMLQQQHHERENPLSRSMN